MGPVPGLGVTPSVMGVTPHPLLPAGRAGKLGRAVPSLFAFSVQSLRHFNGTFGLAPNLCASQSKAEGPVVPKDLFFFLRDAFQWAM